MKEFEAISREILPMLLSNGAKRVALFGSMVRGQDTSESDIDIRVAFKEPIGLLKLAHLQRELSQQLNRSVDLVTEDSLSRYIRPDVEAEKVVLYENGLCPPRFGCPQRVTPSTKPLKAGGNVL
jgi:predicted nucleotidyltransferase